jgi:organic radical activating enzyme
LGIKCQLKCVICSSDFSSSWIKDAKAIGLHKSEKKYNWFKHHKEEIFKMMYKVKKIHFAGGEPLIMKEHDEILDFIMDNNLYHDMHLRYTSNAIELTQRHLDMWTKFKHVMFEYSIDGLYEQNEYMRYGSNWTETYEKLVLLQSNKIDHRAAITVSILNINDIINIFNFFNKNNIPYVYNMLQGPDYLSIQNLKYDDKIKLKDIPQNMKDFMFSKNINKQSEMISYLTSLDTIRKTNFRKTFTHLKEY